MRKYNKNMAIILSGVVIATNTQITTISYALEDDKNQTTLEKSIEENEPKSSNYVKQEIVKVTNEEELIIALENPNIKTVEIKNDIVIKDSNPTLRIEIKGNEKEIRGNGYTVSSGEIFNFLLNTNTKIDNLKLKEIAITSANRENLHIVNNSEISNGEITDCGNITLENVKVNHTMIKSNKNLVINSSKMNKSIIKHFGDEVGELKIINTEIKEHHPSSGLIAPSDHGGNKAPIYLYGGNVELENVKIINPGSNAIYAAGSHSKDITEQKIRIKGTLEVDGAQNEAIVLKMENDSNKNIPLKLYIDGDIKQKGDTYTVIAENEGNHIKIYYDDSKIEKGTDLYSNEYYNTKNREGIKPPLPSYENSLAVVTDKRYLLRSLEDQNIKTIDIRNDIDINSSIGEPFNIYISGNKKEIKGNGHTISNSTGSNWFNIKTNTKMDNLKIGGGSIYTVEGKNLDIVNNSEINGASISLEGNVSLENVKMDYASISGNGNLVVNSSKLKNSQISISDYYENKVGIAKIINTEIEGQGYAVPISLNGGNIELENIKITNPGDHAIYAKGSKKLENKIRIKGTLEIDGAKKDAIVLKKGESSTENPVELYIDGDIKQKGDTYTIKAEDEGTYTKVHYDDSKIKRVTDKWSYTYYSTKNREGNEPKSVVYENKLVGENRHQTAIKVSNEGWDVANTIVIVNSNSMADALSATPYANWLNAPILLTEGNKLNSDTKKEILRLKAKGVRIIGGEGSVSNSVINELKSMNLNVERISGNDRYETSLEIAKKLNSPSEIAVVNGVTGLPDAVSIAPVAAEKDMPIVLVSPKEGIKAFDQYIKDNNLYINKSYIIGKEAAISNKIANKLPNPERLGGIDRNETNAVILEKFYTSEELNNIFIAKDGMKKPDDLIDALSVGVLASQKKSPVVIVGNDLNDKQESLLSKKQPKAITQVGGNGNENAFNKLANMFK
ncbi:cell wall-binding repeat-containing protein [Clostridioides mangenotii]|uniref:cell wall-binding repeat-containing protein n=1 Tax=Metaclostridioides mangenotii TaxID=1540 RepID=UPI001C112C6D|nr:cell wall-binding repeat-containing protein [Clostridioides mangenotii]MBU5307033.1 cell wall-binding repeat-containing protein [Clostridioides mangenotii]